MLRRTGLLTLFFCSMSLPGQGVQAQTIYQCRLNGVLTFSDAPCGDQANVYSGEQAPVSSYEPPAAHTRPAKATQGAVKSKRAQDDSIALAQAKHKAECGRLTTAQSKVRSKMRSGYSAKEGTRLRERQLELNDKLRKARC